MCIVCLINNRDNWRNCGPPLKLRNFVFDTSLVILIVIFYVTQKKPEANIDVKYYYIQ